MRRALFAAVLLLSSCGGSPTRPAPVAASPVLPVSASSGAYTLTLTLSTSGQPTCSNGLCASVSLCSGTVMTSTARFDVRLDRSGDEITVVSPRDTTLVTMRMNTASTPATGSITVAGRDVDGVMVDAKGSIAGSGSANPAIAASGVIDGQVTMGGAGCSNNGHGWTLAPR